MQCNNNPSTPISLTLALALITIPLHAFYAETSDRPYKHSKPQLFLYAARTLRWFIDTRGGRTSSHDKKGDIRHCLPPLIEQYYRHLAIATLETGETLQSLDPILSYPTLNFPGTITLANGKQLSDGIFAIGFESTASIILHRYFHYLDQKPALKHAIRRHKRLQKLLKEKMERNFTFINFNRKIDEDLGPIDSCIAMLQPELDAKEPYSVMENKYQIHITDRSGTTYTLFKSHALTK